jgi:predicted nucleic acid-binding protein
MNDRVFLDTNIFLYVYDEDAPEKQSTAKDVIQRHGLESVLCISTQVIQEFYFSLSRKFARRIPEHAILRATEGLRDLNTVQVDVEMIFEAIALSKKIQISFWDALIVQAALESHCNLLVTEDLQHGRKLGGLTIVNPFGVHQNSELQ